MSSPEPRGGVRFRRHESCVRQGMLSWRTTWAALALAAVWLVTLGVERGRGADLVQQVTPRPRLMFAPGEFQRFVDETGGVRQDAFARLVAEINERGTRAWNERDLQLESHALVARVLLERGHPAAATYLDFARRSLQFFLNTHTYVRWSESHDVVTEGGRWIEAVALAYDWLHPHWSPAERGAAARWLADEIDHWVDRNRLGRASPSPFRNDAARATAAMTLAGLTLFDETGYEATARKALAYVEPYLTSILDAHRYAGAGGGMAEGTFYGNLTAWAQVLTAEALYTGAGVRDAYTRSPFYLARLRYATHAGWPGYLTNQFGFDTHQLAPVFGDARRGPTGSALYHRAAALLLGKRFPTSRAAREAYWVINRPETARTYTREWALYDLLLPSVDVRPLRPVASSYHEPTLGQIFARSDWSDEATWLSFNAGPHLDTHQHYDAGNLTLFRQVDLIVDSGSFDAFGSSHWYNYYARTVAHNTITVTDPQERWRGLWGGVADTLLVNDGGQRTAAPLTPAPTLDEYRANRLAYDHAAIERLAEAEWGLHARAHLTNAYQNPAFQSARPDGSRNRPKVTHVSRDLVYFRRAAGRRDAVVVFDRVVATDPSFRKAVLWHAREPFTSSAPGTRVDEGEIRYTGRDRYDFESLVGFRQGPRDSRARIFVSVFAVDPVRVRDIGRRPSAGGVDHETFGVGHRHRHLKDYLVEDPRGLVNSSRSLGAFNRPEWPPFNPPEQQWLFNDDLVGGWGQSRLQVEPEGGRLADRFLTVLVPADAGEAQPPALGYARASDGTSVGVVISDGGHGSIVVFGADPNGADLSRTALDIPLEGLRRGGELVITSLAPRTPYLLRVGALGRTLRISLSRSGAGGTRADAAGTIRLALDSAGRPTSSSPAAGAAAAGSAVTPGAGRHALGDDTAFDGAASAGPAATGDGVDGLRHPGRVTVAALQEPELGGWDARVSEAVRAGEWRVRETTADAQVRGRQYQRLVQLHRGVPVFGGELTRQIENGRTVSVFGTWYRDIDVESAPRISPADAAAVLRTLEPRALGPHRTPELVVLPLDDGSYRLTYRARIATADDVIMYFLDAETGEAVVRFSDGARPVL
jgi:hypothetical protein